MDWRRSAGAAAQAAYSSNAGGGGKLGLSLPWADRLTGPPVAPAASSRPALLSRYCALKMWVSKSTIWSSCSWVGLSTAWAWPSVALTAWVKRVGSRPSNMMLVMGEGGPNEMVLVLKFRLAERMGRRNTETTRVFPSGVRLYAGSRLQVVGSLTTLIVYSAPGGTGRGIRMSPLLSSREWAALKSL